MLNKSIEQTLLRPDATEKDYERLFEEARKHKFFGVCIHPAYIKQAKRALRGSGVKIVTVIGFPFGANAGGVKAYETAMAVGDGADEIDMVMNISAMKDKKYSYILDEFKKVKKACRTKPLKVIIETDLLTQDEIVEACKLCIKGKVNFVKTSTGYVKDGKGATVDNIRLIAQILEGHRPKIKASGGIRDKKTAAAMIEAGASRIGTSAGPVIMSSK
ncbi:MAG: deoxyribose-phosphate aldolase [Heliobacteriaceae bacterium]|jgi:deoxyribose-phosphate aldolase|nr:deoxyribose-phosphate aldolase [Heliobacteriaceae bacterium]